MSFHFRSFNLGCNSLNPMAKRRANGEGSIRKRADGRWEGRYTVGHDPKTGKQKFKNVMGKTQAEVKEKLKVAIEKSKGLDISKADQFTLSEWLRYWLDNYGKVYLRPSSLTNYTGFLDNQISNDKVGDIKLNKLTTNDLQQFYNRMSESGRVQRKESQNKPRGLSAKSVRNIHCFISHAMNRAVDEKLISENPASRCILPKKEQKEIEILPLTNLQKFFEEAKSSENSKTGLKLTFQACFLARRKGFEPLTFWSVARRSIQLS